MRASKGFSRDFSGSFVSTSGSGSSSGSGSGSGSSFGSASDSISISACSACGSGSTASSSISLAERSSKKTHPVCFSGEAPEKPSVRTPKVNKFGYPMDSLSVIFYSPVRNPSPSFEPSAILSLKKRAMIARLKERFSTLLPDIAREISFWTSLIESMGKSGAASLESLEGLRRRHELLLGKIYLLNELSRVIEDPKPIYLSQAATKERWDSCRVLDVFSTRGFKFEDASAIDRLTLELSDKGPGCPRLVALNASIRVVFYQAAYESALQASYRAAKERLKRAAAADTLALSY